MSAAIWALAASSALAIPIHRHLTVHRKMRLPDSGQVATITRHIVRVEHVAPPYVPPKEPTTMTTSSSSPVSAPVTSVAPAPVGACPASLAGESTSPTAVNPSSGAAGCIQALPSTWAAYGDPAYASAADAPVSVQMEALARIC